MNKVSVLKTISYRVIATISTMVIAYMFTGSIGISFGIGVVEVMFKTMLYFFHEEIWNKIKGVCNFE